MNRRKVAASIAANTRASQEDGHDMIAPARAGWKQKWEDLVDPNRELTEQERYRRAKAAESAHMQRLTLKRWHNKPAAEPANVTPIREGLV